jgi:predicted DNA-binding transcriptional regulator YafY
MPKAAQHHALARQWEILRYLPTRPPGITAGELVDRLKGTGFEVSKRTIERDLTELSTLFGILCNDKGMPYGWYWMRGEPANLPGMSITDAISLQLVEELLRPLLPKEILEILEARFGQAKAKLAELAEGNEVARWVDKVQYVSPALTLLPPKFAEGILVKVQEALLKEKQLRASYLKAGSSNVHDLILHPLGLIQRGPVTYIVATAYDYADIRLYAVHRIRDANVLEDASCRPDGFSLEAYVATGALQFGTGATLQLKARISDTLAAHLEETPMSENQVLARLADGYHLSASVNDSWQLRWWILGQAAGIEILEPLALRDTTRNSLSAALARYAEIN